MSAHRYHHYHYPLDQQRELLQLLAQMPRDSLDPVSQFFYAVGNALEARARTHAETRQAQCQSSERFNSLQSLRLVVRTLVDQGRNSDEIRRQLASQNVPPETVDHFIAEASRQAAAAARAARDREIAELALTMTTAEIAKRLEIHRSTVSRIVTKARAETANAVRDRDTAPTPEPAPAVLVWPFKSGTRKAG
jgi:predicted DNA-binding protein (UPF0251 family)